jgi:hypothetical protein
MELLFKVAKSKHSACPTIKKKLTMGKKITYSLTCLHTIALHYSKHSSSFETMFFPIAKNTTRKMCDPKHTLTLINKKLELPTNGSP